MHYVLQAIGEGQGAGGREQGDSVLLVVKMLFTQYLCFFSSF